METAAEGENLSYVLGLLKELPIGIFVDSIPAVIRGFSFYYPVNEGRFDGDHNADDLVTQILTRLVRLEDETDLSSEVEIQESGKRVASQLYSWYFNSCQLWQDFPDEDDDDEEEDDDDDSDEDGQNNRSDKTSGPQAPTNLADMVGIRRLFTIVLPTPQDWEQLMPVFLEAGGNGSWHNFNDITGEGIFNAFWSAFVVMNLATAYRIMAEEIQDYAPIAEPEALKGVRSIFQPILIADDQNNFYAPRLDEREELGAMLRQAMGDGPGSFEQQLSPFITRGMPAVGKDAEEVLEYLINELGQIDGLPIHHWTPSWTVRDL